MPTPKREPSHEGIRRFAPVFDIRAGRGAFAIDVPRTPDHMRGVIDLRGNVVPAVDLRLRLGLTRTEKTLDTCVMFNLDADQHAQWEAAPPSDA